MSLLLFLLAPFTIFAQSPDAFTGVFKGTARNNGGVLQLGGAASSSTVFMLQRTGDSLHLRAVASGGTERTIGSWPVARVKTDKPSPTEQVLTATGLPKGPLHLRRTLTWTQSAGIRVSATVRTNNASQTQDDFFGGGEVTLTLMKAR
ncbi:MAG: hypothetical protein ACK5GI_01605 [Ignavibacteria bacterium]|jgi:hypothetical protein